MAGLSVSVNASGLEALLREHKSRYTTQLNPKAKKVYVEDPDLPGIKTSAKEKDFGDFYELLAQGWFGGRRNTFEQHAFYSSGAHSPDLVSSTFEYDQKSIGRGTTLKLRDPQLRMYHDRQLLSPHKRIGYQVFRHDVADILTGKAKSRDAVFDNLAKNTLYALDLPLSIMTALWMRIFDGINHRKLPLDLIHNGNYQTQEELENRIPEFDMKSYYARKPYTGIKASTLHGFYFAPEAIIRALDMDPGMFKVVRKKSPVGFMVEGRRVKPFPLLQVFDRSHDAWLDYFFTKLQPQRTMSEELSDSDSSITDGIEAATDRYKTHLSKPRRGRLRTSEGYASKNPNYLTLVRGNTVRTEEDIPF